MGKKTKKISKRKVIKICRYCGQEFKVNSSHRDALYCNGKCREKALHLKRKKNALHKEEKLKEVRSKFGMRTSESYISQLKRKVAKDDAYKSFESQIENIEKELHKN